MKRIQDFSCKNLFKYFHIIKHVCLLIEISCYLDDTVNLLQVRPVKSASFSVQENGDNERNICGRRKISVLDEKALREDDTVLVRDQRIQSISGSYQVILESIGEDPLRQGKFSFKKMI